MYSNYRIALRQCGSYCFQFITVIHNLYSKAKNGFLLIDFKHMDNFMTDELIPFINTLATESNFKFGFKEFGTRRQYLDYGDCYAQHSLFEAATTYQSLTVRDTESYNYDKQKLESVTLSLLTLGFQLIDHQRKSISTLLFVRSQTPLEFVILSPLFRSNIIRAEFSYTSLQTKNELFTVLSGLDKVDYTIDLDTFAKDETISMTTGMVCSNFTQTPDFFYPNIEEGLTNYFDAFLNSTSNILLLIGPPGTGKTNFLKCLFNYAKQDVQMTYDEKLIEQGNYFSKFIESSNQFLVIEDADTILKSRSDGNKLISKFLNIADGIIPNNKKKLIFTTNLPNVKDVDKALIRPGRCFDVLEIGYLNKEAAIKVAQYINVDVSHITKDKYSLAEIYGIKNNFKFHSKLNGFGFT